MAATLDEVHGKLAEAVAVVESARAMPMSASCVVNRGDLLALLDDIEALLPDALSRAQEVLGDKQGVVDEGRSEAARIIAGAEAERRRMLESTDIYAEAATEADRLLVDARSAADGMRVEVEDYVDGKLANFEIVLTKTLAAVERGRQKLSGRHELEDLTSPDDLQDEPLPG